MLLVRLQHRGLGVLQWWSSDGTLKCMEAPQAEQFSARFMSGVGAPGVVYEHGDTASERVAGKKTKTKSILYTGACVPCVA